VLKIQSFLASFLTGPLSLFLGAQMALVAHEISLPRPAEEGKVSVEEAIKGRRTVRHFESKVLTLSQLGQVLWAGQGETEKAGLRRRAAPSGGALYPLDLYAVVGQGGVQGLQSGIYRYLPESHSLREVSPGDKRQSVAKAAWGQAWMADAPAILVVTAQYRRITQKYGERGIRYALIEVGHVGENICLQAVALGLGAGLVGAFGDEKLRALLECPAGEDPLYLLPIGYQRHEPEESENR
jgi:SagB-type dehydrogenase family enzyme